MSTGFDDKEMTVLAEVLKEYLTDLRSEILDTDDFEYKQVLKKKEELLRGIVSKLDKAGLTHLN